MGKKFKGGIISNVAGIWKINNNDEYKADINYTEWKDLSEYFKNTSPPI